MFNVDKGLNAAAWFSLDEDEEWVHLETFPGYFISDYGQVYSYRSDRVLFPIQKRRGYLYVRLQRRGKTYDQPVHWLVALTFLDFMDENAGIGVKHLDGNLTNNRATNLEWYDRNLHSDKNIAVRIVGTDLEFSSKAECARYLRVSTKTVTKLMRHMGDDYEGIRIEFVEKRY